MNDSQETSVNRDQAQEAEIAEHLSRAEDDRSERVVGDRDWQARFLANALVEILQERAAAGQNDAAVADVGGKFGRRAFEGDANRVQNRGDAFGKRFADFAVVNRDGARDAFDQIAALHLERKRLLERVRRADFNFNLLGGALTDEQIVFALQVMHYRLVHFVSGDAYRAGVNDAAHGNDGDVGRAAADVHHHVPGRLLDGQTGADGGGHGLLDEIDFAGARAIGGVLHGALFHRRNFAGNADDDAGMHQDAAVVRFLNEVSEHFLGDFEVGDDAVLHGLDRHHITGRAAKHFLGFLADGDDLAAVLVAGH